MTQSRLPEAILADLVAFPGLPGQPNGPISGWIAETLISAGLKVHRVPVPEGDRWNLFASIGPVVQRGGIILSGHMDVVPVEGQSWTTDPFRLTDVEGRLQGRGATDMKGFLACMIAAVPMFQAAGLKRPIHLAFSCDEEIGCRGVPHLIAELPKLCAPPAGCIVGEPSGLQPVLSHKGKVAYEVLLTGRSAHSSEPGRGVNALYAAAALARTIEETAEAIRVAARRDERFSPDHSTLVAGILRAGSAVNIIPDCASLTFELRTIPGDDADTLLLPVFSQARTEVAAGRALCCEITEISRYPALPPEATELAGLLADWTGQKPRQSVSYGTEAGLFHAAGIPSIVCGPGDIARAHRPDEYITAGELSACMSLFEKLARKLAQ
jgi:acetylornithine deacetylase